MSPPRRRSSRLRGSNGNDTPKKKHTGFFGSRLSSLTERDETPNRGVQSNLDATVSLPPAPQTPATTGRIQAPRFEMHPSHAHRSTTKLPSEEFSLGFMDVHDEKNKSLIETTPSKTTAITSPSFDFKFARPAPDLGPEAQRMMDELRDEALRIKAKLAAEREEERRLNGDIDIMSERKIAKPKGKAGRYSDAHKEEFKKMDSIAGHASAFRAQPGRIVPATTSLKRSPSKPKLAEDVKSGSSVQRSLKRTQSKAKLDEPEDFSLNVPIQRSLKRSKSKAQLDEDEDDTRYRSNIPQKSTQRRDEATPVKRARFDTSQPSSAHRTANNNMPSTPTNPTTPSIPRSHSMLEGLTTPTQSSLARSASIKHISNIPSMTRSPSKASLFTPGKISKSSTTSNFGSIARSFLRRPDKSPQKPAETTTSPGVTTSEKANVNKELPAIPNTPQLDQSKSVKHVNTTPSPQKSGIPRSKSTKTLPGGISYPQLKSTAPGHSSQTVQYPSLENRPLPEPPMSDDSRPPPSVPGTFTFRANQTIKFVTSPRGFGPSPGQASLRQVRPSIAPTAMPGSFPQDNKENMGDISSYAHGISNKKRARAEEEFEDIPAVAHGISNKKRNRAEDSDDDIDEEIERSPKKHKATHGTGQDSKLKIPRLQQKLMAEKAAPQSKIPSPAKKKRVLSLSRLNMLARPKNRK